MAEEYSEQEVIEPASASLDEERPQSGAQAGGQGAQRGRVQRRRMALPFIKIEDIDYKRPDVLAPFLTDHGKILARRRSGVSAKVQRHLAVAVKRARFLGLLPYTHFHAATKHRS